MSVTGLREASALRATSCETDSCTVARIPRGRPGPWSSLGSDSRWRSPNGLRREHVRILRVQRVSEQVRGAIACDGGHEQVAMAGRAADLLQEGELFGGLDTLCNHGQAERVAQRYEGGDQFGTAVHARQAAKERTVNLERVHRKPMQGFEGGVPSPEVVDVKAQPSIVHLAHDAQGHLGAAHQDALGNLEREAVRWQVVASQGLQHLGQQVLVPEFVVRDVDAHVVDARAPGDELSADLVQDPVSESDDEPCLGHNR
jgi:hypothetical protein